MTKIDELAKEYARYQTDEQGYAAMEIFDYAGAVPDPKNQEPFAYLCGWIAKCCDEVKRNIQSK